METKPEEAIASDGLALLVNDTLALGCAGAKVNSRSLLHRHPEFILKGLRAAQEPQTFASARVKCVWDGSNTPSTR